MLCITISVTYYMGIQKVKGGETLHAIYRALKAKKRGDRFFVSLAHIPEHLLHQVELIGLEKRNCLAHYSLENNRALRVQIIPLRPVNKKLYILVSFTNVRKYS